ncbi:amino acid aminotransferase family protein [Striga asiatica]|uniref:Amino acid aminotransferase family protein n=1 Tax=Striga asiatica TaxID=4170 RepID=A0A5A7QM88_STRAF|nr:amino acid aminotransferase family protein [Striga asiatica]
MEKSLAPAMAAAADGEVEVIHMWCSPRSTSTSLMYSFAQRDDVEVLDEPLYATFLRVTGAERPYKEELLSKVESDGNKVIKEIILGPGRKKYRFCKHMASQHLYGLTDDLMKKGKHFILMRNPFDVLISYEKVVPPLLIDLGYDRMVSIYSELSSRGVKPPVIDSDLLGENPEATLRALCDDLGIPFQAAMLKDASISWKLLPIDFTKVNSLSMLDQLWEPGPKPFDGMWAPYWYESTHKSTGFKPPRKYPSPFPLTLYDLLEQSLPFYNLLKGYVRWNPAKSFNPPLPVPANEKLLAWVGNEIVPRESAKVSVLDSVVQGGDAVWEGLRIYDGKIFKLEEHLDRLFDSAKALAFSNVPTRDEVKQAIFKTLIRNGMFNNAHIRLTLTRGKKVTSGMSPAFNLYGCTLIVLAEWKPPVYDNESGIILVTATTRRNSPNNLDSKIHHNNLLNNILAKVEGNNSQADDAIMLDKDGYVSETNATNIFLVKKGRVATPHADYCLPGITRETVMGLVVKEKFLLAERRISLSEFHTADEVFTTGTMGELSPVVKIDGRIIGDGKVGPVTRQLQNAYKELTAGSGVPIPTYQQP